jgi:hypothetical protein
MGMRLLNRRMADVSVSGRANFLLLLLTVPVIFSCPLWARFTLSVQTAGAASPAKSGARVPFVGCKADGQAGPLEAPKGASRLVPIAPEAAQKFAYYKAEQGLGVLALRGWFCFEIYGSDGYALYVSPQQLNPADVLSGTWSGLSGPAIELFEDNGDTSGRFGVARVIARVFPDRRSFVQKVIDEGIEPASSFPFGSYPEDLLTYRSKNIVEFETPANEDGLGTNSRLKKSGLPINGVAILTGEAPDLLVLSVRLSPNLAGLAADIVKQTERETTNTVSKQ